MTNNGTAYFQRSSEGRYEFNTRGGERGLSGVGHINMIVQRVRELIKEGYDIVLDYEQLTLPQDMKNQLEAIL